MGDLTGDQLFVLVRETAFVLLWATVALAATRRLHDGPGWAPMAVLGSILLLMAAGVNLVQAKFLFVDHDLSLTLTMADWHLLKLPTVVMFLGAALLAKAVLADRSARISPCSSTSSSTPAPISPPTAPGS